MGNANVLAFTMEFELACNCPSCGVPVVMSVGTQRDLRRSHRSFYCLNGHSLSWSDKSDLEQLKCDLEEANRKLAFERERAATNYAAREKAEAEARKLRKRVSNGVCPCCNRTFANVARHVSTKHPEFKA